MKLALIIFFFAICLFFCSCDFPAEEKKQNIDDMAWVSSNTFKMGSDNQNASPAETPAHDVMIKGFWIDKTEVTNFQFKEFIEATNYITVAERKLDWEKLKQQLPEGIIKPHDSLFVPGSIVFIPPKQAINPNNPSLWFHWVAGANWKHPKGPKSNLNQRWNHPVVHIAYEDALAYADWKGKRLPTEAEWEMAAQSNVTKNPWENLGTKALSNTFQGIFPYKNTLEDGFLETSPVKYFPPNELGVYDMIGNVWEWTSDWYNVSYYTTLDTTKTLDNPVGAVSFYDPFEPLNPKRVIKGGSFLCATDYCSNYRTSARLGSAIDTGISNIGFRCVKNK